MRSRYSVASTSMAATSQIALTRLYAADCVRSGLSGTAHVGKRRPGAASAPPAISQTDPVRGMGSDAPQHACGHATDERTEAGSTVQEGVNWGDMAVYFSRHLGGPFLELVRFHRDRFHHDQFLRLQHSVVNCGARAFTHF